jgi:hypothetical protein
MRAGVIDPAGEGDTRFARDRARNGFLLFLLLVFLGALLLLVGGGYPSRPLWLDELDEDEITQLTPRLTEKELIGPKQWLHDG